MNAGTELLHAAHILAHAAAGLPVQFVPRPAAAKVVVCNPICMKCRIFLGWLNDEANRDTVTLTAKGHEQLELLAKPRKGALAGEGKSGRAAIRPGKEAP